MGLDEASLSDLAAGRHGVFTRADALEVGATPRQITTALANGRWLRCATNVYGYPGHADTWQRRLWIATLNAGDTAVVGFESAGQIHGFHALDRDRLTLIVDRPRRHAPDGVVWHRLEDLRPDHVTLVDGLAVTTVARTVVDLAAVLRNGRFEQLVEDGIVRGLFTIGEVGGMLAQVRRRGKPGVLRTEAILDLLGPGDGLSHPELEALLDHALALAGLPVPHREHPLPSVQCLLGFVDRCYPEAKWILEADGRKWHERRRNMARDAERDTEAARCGYLTTRMMWEHLKSDPGGCAAALADIYRQRLALFDPR